MKEDFLQFVWQYQYFDAHELTTTDGDKVEILDKGAWNTQNGADFQLAQIALNGVQWAGTVEIHLRASDWHKHAHAQQLAYQNVILHVVWEADVPILRPDGTPLPTVVLAPRVFKKALQQYHNLLISPQAIPCGSQWGQVRRLSQIQLLDRAIFHRLERKSRWVKDTLQENAGDWEETTYQLLARHWGMKHNQEPFSRLAQRVPLKLIHKHRDNLLQLEALFFGQAGFLSYTNALDDYMRELQREYHFLAQKYQLAPRQLSPVEWQFAKLRPANAPMLRLAQLAGFVQSYPHLLSYFLHTPLDELLHKPETPLSAYWQTHYQLGKPAKGNTPAMGQGAWQNVLMNVATNILTAYGHHTQNDAFVERATDLLARLPAEKNGILEDWQALGVKVATAFDSQALLEQYNEFCTKKRCLQCVIGASLLR